MAWHDNVDDLQAKVQEEPDDLDIHVHQHPGEIKYPGVSRDKRRQMFPRLWDPRGYDSQKHCGPVRQIVPKCLQVAFDRELGGVNYNGVERVRLAYHPHWNRYTAEQAMPNKAWDVFSVFDEATPQFDQEEVVAPDLKARGDHFYQTRNGGVGNFRLPSAEDFRILRKHSYLEHTDQQIEETLAVPEDQRDADNDRVAFDQDLDIAEYYYDLIHREDYNHGRRRKSVMLSPEMRAPTGRYEEVTRNGYKVRAKKGSSFAAQLAAESRPGAREDQRGRAGGLAERTRAHEAHEAAKNADSG